ncbi:CvpA family protein [Parasporobacterium paucivorans]|uniref:Colicin V production protein n=1 Tax=Parasporobacterium paucivorans DSM 15970 TaxID=1122934 RepID=A0A1M6J8W3_9FIRM|nr:CvpA family protein [Parasporobacterium paucivorans]SHJ43117.1 Colicin V production protein [Parasporobacterium paucivorans DSM 15970]
MDNILLAGVLLFMVIMAIAGFRKGALRIVVSVAALILTLFLAAYFTPEAAKLLKEHTPMYETVYSQMDKFVGERLVEGGGAGPEEIIGNLPLPGIIRDVLVDNNNEESYGLLGATDLRGYTTRSLSGMLVNAIAFIALFIVISIIFRIIMVVVDIIGRIPIIRGINRLAGLFVGLAQSILILWVLCVVLTAFSGTSGGQQVMAMVADSRFLTMIYDHNLLMGIITNVFMLFG